MLGFKSFLYVPKLSNNYTWFLNKSMNFLTFMYTLLYEQFFRAAFNQCLSYEKLKFV